VAVQVVKHLTPFDGSSELYEWALAGGETGEPARVGPGKSDKTVSFYDQAGGSLGRFEGTLDDGTLTVPEAAHWFTVTDAAKTPIAGIAGTYGSEILQNCVQYRPAATPGVGLICRLLVTGR